MGRKGPVSVALLGAGARGELNLATLAKRHADKLRIVAVAEPNEERRTRFMKKFDIPPARGFADWRELLAQPRLADAVLNALPCTMHYESAMATFERGYHNFLEKPVAHHPGQCVELVEAAEAAGVVYVVALQSRHNDIYTRVRRLREREIGRLMTIDCQENVGYWHFIMSYVRGIHRNERISHSFLLAKGIHDLDLVTWYAGAPAGRVSSFGELSFFQPASAPPGAPPRCTDGCPVGATCEFSAIKQFLDPGRPDIPWTLLTNATLQSAIDVAREPRFRTLASVISHDISRDNIRRILETESHGQCVFGADNDVVDHQTVSVEYENGVVASFSLNGFSLIWERTLNLHGTRGEVLSKDFTGRLDWRTYNPARHHRERVRYHGIIHGGGDERIIVDWADAILEGRGPDEILCSGKNTLESHLLCLAAEDSRRQGRTIDMAEYRAAAGMA